MKKITSLLLAAAAVLTAGCVNEAYDLSKLDWEMNLFSTKGIEIPLPDNITANTVDVLDGCTFPGLEETAPLQEFSEEITVEPLEPSETSKTIESKGEYKFDFTVLPELYRSKDSEMVFDDNTFFKMDVTSTFEGKTTMSCDVFDAKSGNKVGEAKDLNVPADGSGVKIPFAYCGMKWIPDQVVVKNIKFTVSNAKSSTKAGTSASQLIKMIKATSNVFPYILKGSKVKFGLDFDDFLKELNVNVEDLTDVMDVQSFHLYGNASCNVPAIFEGTMTGDATGDMTFEGPSQSDVKVTLKCPNGLGSIKKVHIAVSCLAKEDISLKNVDQYVASFHFKSINLDEGIIVTPDKL